MNKFEMTCSCGDKMSVEAANLDEAKMKMKGVMDQAAIDKHMADKHPGQSMTKVMVDAEIDKNMQPVATPAAM